MNQSDQLDSRVETNAKQAAPSASLTPDLRAGLIVFLVAVPLCLGIATASGAPPLSGLIAGIVGGIVVAVISKSPLSVAGPAAGLTVIVLEAIQRLGFQAFLLATMIAGGVQVLLGALGMGRLGQLVPNAVIRGMLAAIGLILILKQLPHAVGYDPDYVGHLAFQADGQNAFSELWQAVAGFSAAAATVAALAGLTMYLWRDYRVLPLRRYVPRELAAVSVGLFCTLLFAGTGFELTSQHRIEIPVLWELGGLGELWVVPDFGAITNPDVWKAGLTIAVVASIESLLSVSATDRLGPYRTVTPPDRELVAQGSGNLLSGFFGGLPVTAVIVRSFTNIQAGGRTRKAAIFHGLLLLVATLAFASVLNLIPLAALAVVLLVVGYKLTPPKLYREVWQLGYDQFVPFVATVGCILVTDLLTGTLCGMAVSLFFAVWNHYQSAIVITDDGSYRLIRFTSNVSFLHKARIKQALSTVPQGGYVVLDAGGASRIDADVIELIREFQEEVPHRGVTFSMRRSPAALAYIGEKERAA